MNIDKKDIEKYIFDPKNPKQCKSYQLLLNITREEHFVYVDSNYMSFAYKDFILNDDFYRKLWDKPSNFDKLSFDNKIKIFKDKLSNHDYINHINSLKIDKDNSIYTKLFKSFFDLFLTSNYIKINKSNDGYIKDLITAKLIGSRYNLNYSILLNGGTYSTPIKASSHKILFTDNLETIKLNHNFYNISSVIITNLENQSFFQNNTKINAYVKPIFLKKMEDLDILLNVLENDLQREKSKNITKEKISTIEKIEIKEFFSIEDIKLENLKKKREIYIVGENGDGKTLLLQAIAVGLKGSMEDGLKDFRKIKNSYRIEISDKENCKNNLFAYGANRNNSCQMEEDKEGYLTLFNNNYDLKNPIKWLQYLDYNEKSGKTNVISVEEAKKLLQKLLNSNIKIEITPDNVRFTEKGAEVSFNQLSAGYKSVIIIICDLIGRLAQNQAYIDDIAEFQGIVLIDEVELHLHPKWKYNFMKKLRDTFPLIQFIVTTHSPTVILGANKDAVFYKIYKDEGIVCISNQIKNEGFTNNSLISSPLFDLETITSRDYEKDVSSADYKYEKIHKVISKRIKEDINVEEDELLKLIEEELDKL